ncbi:MAG TPA: PD-(D/E)XK nuclease family protein, partial [Bacillales bacterium]|nr:PD-(D/E)XK nuclease family protein [Bacillales bacterium]
MLDKELGFATKRIDPEKRISYPTLSMFAAKRKAEMEMLAEEMRVLYVALTRAREKLYLVATDKKTLKTLTSWTQVNAHPEWLLPDFLRANAKTFLDWIGPAVIRHRAGKALLDLLGEPHHAMAEVASDASTWQLSVVSAGQLAAAESERLHDRAETGQLIRSRQPVPVESPYKEQVHERLSWGYSWEKSVNRMAKQTVSEIKRQREHFTNVEGSDTSLIRSFRSSIAERPKFMQATTLTASEKGTAMHTVMQHLDFRSPVTADFVAATIDRLVVDEIMTEGEAGVVDIAAIVQFFETDLGQRVLQAEQIEREVPFSFAIPAAEAYGDVEEGDELVLIQGVIDCLLTEPDGMVLIDYKSDAIERKFMNGFQEAKPVLADRYRLQLDMYAKAIQQIRQMPLQAKYL